MCVLRIVLLFLHAATRVFRVAQPSYYFCCASVRQSPFCVWRFCSLRNNGRIANEEKKNKKKKN